MTALESRVPVVLPLVDVTIDKDGMARVTIDNAPADDPGPVSRDGLERVLHDVTAKLGPVRVRVTESDGSEFTDVILPVCGGATAETPREAVAGISGGGFLPEEEVDVAVIVAHHKAGADGRAHLRLPPAVLAGRAGTVVLLGRTSGTFTVCEST